MMLILGCSKKSEEEKPGFEVREGRYRVEFVEGAAVHNGTSYAIAKQAPDTQEAAPGYYGMMVKWLGDKTFRFTTFGDAKVRTQIGAIDYELHLFCAHPSESQVVLSDNGLREEVLEHTAGCRTSVPTVGVPANLAKVQVTLEDDDSFFVEIDYTKPDHFVITQTADGEVITAVTLKIRYFLKYVNRKTKL